jgi:hypothetical protein
MCCTWRKNPRVVWIKNAPFLHVEMTSWILPKGLDDGLPVPVGDFSLNKSAPGNRNFVKKEIVIFFFFNEQDIHIRTRMAGTIVVYRHGLNNYKDTKL